MGVAAMRGYGSLFERVIRKVEDISDKIQIRSCDKTIDRERERFNLKRSRSRQI